jgi:hypothetical protein
MLGKVVSVHLLELRRQIVRPVAAVLEAVMKLAADQAAGEIREGLVEWLEILND